MSEDALDALATLAGIEPAYRDFFGRNVVVSPATKALFLRAMGYPVDDGPAGLTALLDARWRATLEPVSVVRSTVPPSVALTLPAGDDASLDWTVRLEDGREIAGRAALERAPDAGTREIDGVRYERASIRLADGLPLGYHRLAVRGASAALIVVPPAAWLPPALESGAGIWGLAVQLYALRAENGGYGGDFSTLGQLAARACAAGAQAIGLNPLHALNPLDPAACSPYDPTSRLWLNMLYVDVEALDDFRESARAQEEARAHDLGARDPHLVDYEALAAAKLPVLERCFEWFRAEHRDDERARDLASFVGTAGTPLRDFALYCALAEDLHARTGTRGGWSVWPPELRRRDAEAVEAFAREHPERIEFHLYVQWQADRQLARAAAACAGSAVGLYRDLAVGTRADGADSWSARDAFVPGIDLGAPPDPLNLQGQNWGLTPFHPDGLRGLAYAPFVALLRANMRHAGALRIDHVMSLRRLFWIPHGAPASEGAYVRYPLDDLLGIVALESVRARCAVIGEDLGTVPEGFRERLGAERIFGFRLLYFEREENERFAPPEAYPAAALVSTGTHDLPSLAAWWTGADLEVREQLGLLDAGAAQASREERERARRLLLEALVERTGLGGAELDALRGGGPPDEALAALVESAYAYLAQSRARFLIVQLEDVLRQIEAMNIPGTYDQHPNWRRRLSADVAQIAADPSFRRLAARLSELRPAP